MYQEVNIPVAQLREIIESLPPQLNPGEHDRRRFVLREPIDVYVNHFSPLPLSRQQREVEFIYNFKTNDWELRFIVTEK